MVSRSNTLSTIRHDSAATIFDLPAPYFSNRSPGDAGPEVSRDTIPEVQRLLGLTFDEDGNTIYARIAPVMCLNNDPSQVSNYFLNPCLFRVRL